ncbi:DUF4255 domain-containing protein [Humitalea sp. 24SJ18S-53]|uniref:DUF4255 domain-containing protein n=1 Tax=Humitalea sp. 24SJ18S-53 TaxID=3422307 RepID=UPI003D6788B6
MSNGFAIASVTRVLQDLLQTGLTGSGLSAAVGGSILVSALPPDRVRPDSNAAEVTQLNLFLHQIAPNAAWAGGNLPERDSRGGRIAEPLMGLTLGYLLSAYSSAELQGEILLGHAMQLLHENAVLARDRIRTILANPPGGGTAPAAWQALIGSDLADQAELIRVTPHELGLDGLSKLWTSFQSTYRPSAAYQVSVLLLERRRPVRAALPVLTRGEGDPTTGRDQGVIALASLATAVPSLFEIGQPAARLGETVVLRGAALEGDAVQALLRDPVSGQVLVLPAPGTAAEVSIALPPDPPAAAPTPGSPEDPNAWRAGLYMVSLRVTRGARVIETNALPLLLAPRLRAIAAVAEPGGVVRLDVTASPPLRPGQVAGLVVGSRAVPGGGTGSALVFRATGLPTGVTVPVRLRVDGAESLLVDRSQRPPRFDPTQQVALP